MYIKEFGINFSIPHLKNYTAPHSGKSEKSSYFMPSEKPKNTGKEINIALKRFYQIK